MAGRAGTGAPIALCQEHYPRLTEAARRIARPLGYAIGVHGSQLYDLDLIAAPWSEPCVEPHELAARLARGLRRIAPLAPICLLARGRRPACEQGNPKPHGRVAFTIIMARHLHIDLSVMPPIRPKVFATATGLPWPHEGGTPAYPDTDPRIYR